MSQESLTPDEESLEQQALVSFDHILNNFTEYAPIFRSIVSETPNCLELCTAATEIHNRQQELHWIMADIGHKAFQALKNKKQIGEVDIGSELLMQGKDVEMAIEVAETDTAQLALVLKERLKQGLSRQIGEHALRNLTQFEWRQFIAHVIAHAQLPSSLEIALSEEQQEDGAEG